MAGAEATHDCAQFVEMKVQFLGHAGLLVDSGRTRLLIDGWFSSEGAFDASWFQLPENHHIGRWDWSGLDGVIVSHEHMDHLDPAFLRGLPAELPLYVPAFASPLLARKLIQLVGRKPRMLTTGKEHRIGDIDVRIWTETSPMNHDSTWLFKHDGQSIVHTVDSRLNQDEVEEVLACVGGQPDLLLAQGSGASWYPLAYENYDDATKHARGIRKRAQKLAYVRSIAEQLRPKTLVICAGPAVFLDESLRYANADPSFPTPDQSRASLVEAGYAGRIEVPLPGDRLDLTSGELTEDTAMHSAFAWADTPSYIVEYARRMQPNIAAVYRRADAIAVPDMHAAVCSHFEKMTSLSAYFNERIDMTLCLDVEGPQGGQWLVDFRPEPKVRRAVGGESYQYRYRLHSRWLKRILVENVPWEDFLLSLRFSAFRDPDVYNDHLLGVLKFNDALSLRAVENWEKRLSDELIVITAGNGARYEIAKYCPHAGASMEGALIEGDTITCLNHHYVFDLESGRCLTGNCTLKTKRLA
jgi:UDP-MurNAc hydroxylase